MRLYEKLIKMYTESIDTKLNSEVVRQCETNSVFSIELVVKQFHYLVLNSKGSEEYLIVKRFLVSIFGSRIIEELEEM